MSFTTNEAVRSFYDIQATKTPDSAAVLGEPSQFAVAYREAAEWQTFRKLVRFDHSMHILELGCGGGRWLRRFSPIVRQVTGVELSPVCASIARRNLAKSGNVAVVESSLEDYAPSCSFDLIYFSGVLLYLSDDEVVAAMKKYACVLTTNGVVIIRDSISTTETHDLLHPDAYSARYRSVSDWMNILNAAGLTIVRQVPATPNKLSEPLKHSRTLARLLRCASLLRLSGAYLRLLRLSMAIVNNRASEEDGYSHDFLVANTQPNNSDGIVND